MQMVVLAQPLKKLLRWSIANVSLQCRDWAPKETLSWWWPQYWEFTEVARKDRKTQVQDKAPITLRLSLGNTAVPSSFTLLQCICGTPNNKQHQQMFFSCFVFRRRVSTKTRWTPENEPTMHKNVYQATKFITWIEWSSRYTQTLSTQCQTKPLNLPAIA